MKKIGIILFLCIIVCNYIFAVPVNPTPRKVIQPNGDTICIHPRGDEYGAWTVDDKGNVISKNSEGYWVYVAIENGKRVLTNQMVTKTSIPENIDREAVWNYIRACREKCYQRRHRRLPEFSIKNERVKKWINLEIECCDIKDPINNLSWVVRKTVFGDYDFSCLLLYKNDSTGEYYIVNNYIDFSVRLNKDIAHIVDIYRCDGRWCRGGAILDKNFNIYEQIKVVQNKQLKKRINEINRFFEKKYKQTDKLIKIAKQKNKEYSSVSYSPCKNCEKFFKTHTLVDVIGYSYIKYPIGAGNKMK
ncbi:MAG: hypothetical protein IKY67_01570 [Paludibacteraceae bacterium]|nr:hypothetical protein [Paludibacteraceae bacterium]